MGAEPASREAEACPFLVPVMADRLWMYPIGAYCRRPDGRVRVPTGATATFICMTAAHLVCPGYLASMDREESRAGAPT